MSCPLKIAGASSMGQAFKILRSYPTIGDFLAYQFVTDLNYGNLTDFSEMEFVVPGPGALDGIRKCFSDLGGVTESDAIKAVTESQEQEFERLGIRFRSLGGRQLQLIDCQNLFCEVSKYARVKHPDIRGVSDRKRIKQIYRPSRSPIAYWYPPKWGINHLIPPPRRAGVIPLFQGATSDEVWQQVAQAFRQSDRVTTQDSRGGPTREILHAAISIEDPRQRWAVSRQPALNPALALAEVVWIMTGRSDPGIPRILEQGVQKFRWGRARAFMGHTAIAYAATAR